ncbi:NDR1/HIN1-like protein 13 [Populus alba x Populus x berolinensis]|nr:NDR1/HIN1-like protein 13 [Populus alba x Populus x berolinensis]
MTEQVPTVPHSDAIPKIHDPVATPNQPFFEPGTYVIQIPRDQIYRFPPPGNASVAQRQRNPHQKKHKSCCGRSCFWLNVHNSNRRSSILYQQGGAVSLSFRQQNVATGKFPTFHQGHKNSTDIGIVLKGTGVGNVKPIASQSIGSGRPSFQGWRWWRRRCLVFCAKLVDAKDFLSRSPIARVAHPQEPNTLEMDPTKKRREAFLKCDKSLTTI